MRYSHRSTSRLRCIIEDAIGTTLNVAAAAAEGLSLYDKSEILAEPPIIVEKNHVSPILPAGYPPFEVLVFGDLHVGCPRMPLEKLRDVVVPMINRKNAEHKARTGRPLRAFFVGDGINTPEPRNGELVKPEQIGRALRDLETKTYAVMGDHDEIDDSEGMRRAYQDAGMILLDNDAEQDCQDGMPVWIAGLGEYFAENTDLKRTFAKVKDGNPVYVIGHRPDAFSEIPQEINMVMGFAGHTHGGQIVIFGKPIVTGGIPRNLAHGICPNNGRPICVTSGVGGTSLFWGSNVQPEIMHVTVTGAQKPVLAAI